MLRVDVRGLVNHVGDHVAGGRDEQGVVGVEDLPRDHREPFPQQAARVLALLSLEHNVEALLPLGRAQTVQLAERVREQMLTTHLHIDIGTAVSGRR